MSDENKEFDLDAEREDAEESETGDENLEDAILEEIEALEEGEGILEESDLLDFKVPLTAEDRMSDEEKEARSKRLLFVKEGGIITDDQANLIITEESHGFCNSIKRYLLKSEHVLFASYKKIFYEDPTMFINTDGKINAMDAVIEASDKLYTDLTEFENQFTTANKKFK
ncbi:hypothetical protein GF325_13570 [Candidatus Bathyarchaeota archaeon]|nr:hypothetical protein [Candidatus Bathyarchaeota archaeon]